MSESAFSASDMGAVHPRARGNGFCCSREASARAQAPPRLLLCGVRCRGGGLGHGGGLGGGGREEVCAHADPPTRRLAMKTNRLIPGTPFASNKELIGKIVFIAVSHADNRIVHVEIDFNSAPSIKAAAHAQDKRRIIHLKIIANVAT